MASTTGIEVLVPSRIQPPFDAILREAGAEWTRVLGERLISLVLFGSVARGAAAVTSDIDLLAIADGVPWSLRDRRRPFLQTWEAVRKAQGLPWVEWNLVVKSREEGLHRSPLYLDMVDDGVLLLDRDGFFAAVLDGLRRRMKDLGSRRVVLPNGSWYWILKSDYRFGEEIEL